MKRNLIIALMAFGVMSCANENDLVTARFGYNGYESGSLTKAEPTIGDAIRESLPTTFPLDLYLEKKNEHFHTEIGKEISIPSGEYMVEGINDTPTSLGGGNSFYQTPKMSISQRLTVDKSQKDYPLTAEFQCFAIVVDFDEVESVSVGMDALDFFRSGKYGICYVNDFSTDFELRVYPKGGTENEEKTFYFSKKNVNGYVHCQNGYYYLVHPNIIDLMGMSFSLNYTEMLGEDLK